MVFSHVRGPQDDNKTFDVLPIEAQLNVEVDKLAGEFRRNNPDKRRIVPRVGSNPAHYKLTAEPLAADTAVRSAKDSASNHCGYTFKLGTNGQIESWSPLTGNCMQRGCVLVPTEPLS